MKHIKLFEEFEEIKKPTFFQKALQGTKSILGIESKEDRETIENIHRLIGLSRVSDVKEIKPGVIVAFINRVPLTVDTTDNTIIYKGNELKLKDMESACEELYNRLKISISPNTFLTGSESQIDF